MIASAQTDPAAVVTQVPYWIAVLTPEEWPFGMRRTDPRIDTIDSSVVTTARTQWTGPAHPSRTTLLAVLAATVGAWQADSCRNNTSGVLIDIETPAGDYFPVRLPSIGDAALLTEEVRRRVAAAPHGGVDYRAARSVPALARKAGAQIAFHDGSDRSTAGATVSDDVTASDDVPLPHNLTVTCTVTEIDSVTFVEAEFRWNYRVFTRADVDDFERFWDKTISKFV